MRAAIYLRQSKDSKQDGLAVDRREADCRRLAAERGWVVVEPPFVDNDTSASSGKRRPRFEDAMALVDRGGVDVLIAWHMDRLTRRLTELEDIITRCEKAGVRVATVSGDLDLSTDAGRLVGRILASVARGEIERKSARQKAAGRQAATAGLAPRRRAFGFTNGAHHPEEAPALVELYDKVLSGMTLVSATRWLNEHGHRTTTGKPWDRTSVRKMLRNPRNAGLRAYQGEVVTTGQWEPIVSEEVWRAAVELLGDPDRRPVHVGGGRKWLGSGLFECHCGAKVRVNYPQAGTRTYACSARKHMSRSADPVDFVVTRAVERLLKDPRTVGGLAPAASDTRDLRGEAKRLRLRLRQIEDDYADAEGRMSFATFERVTGKITDRLAEVNARLAEAGSVSALDSLLASADPVATWEDADVSVRQAIIDGLVKVTILPVKRGSRTFDETAVRIEPRAAAAN